MMGEGKRSVLALPLQPGEAPGKARTLTPEQEAKRGRFAYCCRQTWFELSRILPLLVASSIIRLR
jgi:hypothetical protein